MKRYLAMILVCLLVSCSVAIPQPGQTAPAQPAGTASPTPPAWANLGLTGSLLLILHKETGVDLVRMDLKDGSITPVYQAPDHALLSSAVLSPDHHTVLLVYAPPPTQENQVTYTSLYLLPLDVQAPQPQALLPPPAPGEAYFAPVWAPDGQSVVSSHFRRGSEDGSTPDHYSIEQITLAGKITPLLDGAMWPALSPDGQRLSYVTALSTGGQNDLYQAQASGSGAQPAIPPGSFPAVDDHFYTPDGRFLVFSAVNPPEQATPTALTGLERLLGVGVASAHNVPSDWYHVPAGGGAITRLTTLADTGMYAALSPDGGRVAFITQTGIYVMNLDGTQLTRISELVATGTVDWLP